jgi:flagellar hook assembly protein FlgD
LPSSNILSDITLSDNNSLALKDPNEDIIDQVGWSQIPSGTSWGRKWDTSNNLEQDFESQTPTPGMQNVSAPTQSNDASITSAIYNVSPIVNGMGTITNIPIATAKSIFLNNLMFAAGAVENTASSSLSDPIVTGNILEVTAQDGTTNATYTITINSMQPNIFNYALNNLAQNVTFNPNISSPVNIMINANEPVKFNRIYVCPNSATICDGSHDVIYFTQITSFASTASKSWDGKTSSGAVVPDGVYKLSVDIVDESGNEFNGGLTPYTIAINTKVYLSNDATITSSVYKVSSLVNIYGNISNVFLQTPRSIFLNNLTFAAGAVENTASSSLSDPIASGDTILVTAQDGKSFAVYTVSVDPTTWSQGTINSFTNGDFVFNTSDFMPSQASSCIYTYYIYQNIFPARSNYFADGSGGSCSGAYPTFEFNMASRGIKTAGEYDFYLSDCMGYLCRGGQSGDYYRMYFDGTNWSAVNSAPPILPTVTSYTLNGSADNLSFNPDNSEKASIVINTNEPVYFNHIYICPNSCASCDGSGDIKSFYQTSSCSSTVSKVWDGTASIGGGVVPDGTYEIGVQITDATGNKLNSTLFPYVMLINTTSPSD